MKKPHNRILIAALFFIVCVSVLFFVVRQYTAVNNFKIAGVMIGDPTTPPPTATSSPTNTPLPVVATSTPVPVATKAPVVTKKVVATAKPPTAAPTATSVPITVVDTNSYTIRVRVIRADNQTFANSQIEIDGQQYTLDSDSTVEFTNIALGEHEVTAEVDSIEKTKNFVLGTSDIAQVVTVVLPVNASSAVTKFDPTLLYCLIGLILLVILFLIIFFLYRKKKKKNQKTQKPVLSGKRKTSRPEKKKNQKVKK